MNTNMTQNENGTIKKKPKLNVFDFIIMFIIILLIGFAIFWTTPWSQGLKNQLAQTVSIQYTVEIKNIDQDFLDKLHEGDLVIDSVSKNEIGTIVAIETDEYKTLSANADGLGVMVEAPEKYTVIITISSDASYQSGSGYSINGCRIAIGEAMTLRFPNYVGDGYCIGLVTG